MKRIQIRTNDGNIIHINKDQICSVEQLDSLNVRIVMSSGEVFVTSKDIKDLFD